jgi:nucleoside-diphosphate-sugar epimerase
MPEYLHPHARELWRATLEPHDRVLVIGATGWFGQTVTELMHRLSQPTMYIASRERDYRAGHAAGHAVVWNIRDITSFGPTVVVDCAFLTRDLLATTPLDEYVRSNEALTANLLAVSALPSVRRVMTVSSGAAVHPVDALSQSRDENPYGRLKREAEQSLATLARERGIAAVVARAWSVSGAFVLKPQQYALSDMILQAQAGAVQIAAAVPVFRRYVSVEDLLAVSLASASPTTPVIDSGGTLVEMQELAEVVVAEVNPGAAISRAPRGDGEANRYYASLESWEAATASLKFREAPLAAQIRVAETGLSR